MSGTGEAPIVSTKQGQLRGKTLLNYNGETFFSFQGIPYAKAPVGELRFKRPQPPEPWSGILDATKEGPECPSIHIVFGNFIGSEDNCLNLNIYTKNLPDETKSQPKPVMVWIYGGAFTQGSNKTDLYGPDYLMMEDIVLVTINYRTGALGFLSVNDNSLEIPGNAGLKDQVAALQWIQDNIENFNGDKNNVTIFGESAGGASVHCLVLSPLAKGLFHKAIIQSGSALNFWAKGTRGLDEMRKNLKLDETDEKKIVEHLRSLPAENIVKAVSKKVLFPRDIRYYAPVVEGPIPDAFLPDSPENIIKSGNYNKVPMIIGYNNLEGLFFQQLKVTHPSFNLLPDVLKEIPFYLDLVDDERKLDELREDFKNFYFGNVDYGNENKNSDEAVEKLSLLKTDSVFVQAIQSAVKEHQKTTDKPIYLYRMSVDTSLNMLKRICAAHRKKLYAFLMLYAKKAVKVPLSLERYIDSWFSHRNIKGASHADDLSYLWKTFWTTNFAPGSIEEISIKRFVRLWTNFAKTGNPTPDVSDQLIGIEWKPLDDKLTYLDIGEELSLKNNPDHDRMLFWDKIFEKYVIPKTKL